VPTRIGGGGTGKHLVPGTEPRPLPVDGNAQQAFVCGGEFATAVPLHEREQVLVRGDLPRVNQGALLPQSPDPLAQQVAVRPFRPFGGTLHQIGSDQQVDPRFLARGDPFSKIAMPRGETIDPCLDRVLVNSDMFDREFALPAVVDQRPHGRLVPHAVRDMPVTQHRGDRIVAVTKHIGLHRHFLANGSLDGKSAVIDLRPHTFDDSTGLTTHRVRRLR
jgi:hypothetical protein